MPVPSPSALLQQYGHVTPEQLAMALGFRVQRRPDPPSLSGVTVLSAYEPEHTIILFAAPLQQRAILTGLSLTQLEQWHIAHELYHGLSEDDGLSPWRLRETDADLWADKLLVLAKKLTESITDARPPGGQT